MNIANQLESIVNQLVEEIKTKLDVEIQTSIVKQIDSALKDYDFDSKVEQVAAVKLDDKVNNFQFDISAVSEQISQIAAVTLANLSSSVAAELEKAANEQVAKINVTPIIESTLKTYLGKMRFPDESIKSQAIDFTDLTLSGDHIDGGIIKNFASTGIDDKATQCQVTILDSHVIVERPILTTGVQVQGNVKVENAINVGTVNAVHFNENSEGFAQIVDFVETRTLQNILEHGVVAPKLVYEGAELINKSEIAPSILKSNLRKVGTLEELQTRGETLLDNTLFVNNKRVGINTLEPTYALTVWDGEVEVAINKVNQTRAFIGTHRPIAVTLGANGKENISLDADGSVTINDLRIGALPISTASNQPTWAGRAGEIVFNDSPKIGVPIGWVCLDGHRWAKFGIITE